MPDSQTYLVIDQGGHASRAAIFDRAGQIIAIKSVPITTSRHSGDRVEHSPEELITSITEAIQGVVQAPKIEPGAIKCIGLATQRSSIVCWDRISGVALSPVISWQDRRTAETIAKYSDHAESIHRHTGLVLSAHYGATKLKWCLDNISAVWQAYRNDSLACGPLSSFILFRLLEEKPFVVDPANASRTLLWNYRSGNWQAELLQLFGISEDILPHCVPNRYDYGHISIGTCTIPVSVVTGDQSAALYAFGKPRLDTTYINIGTGAFLQRPLQREPVNTARQLASVVWRSEDDTQFVLEGTVNGAGSALQEFAQSAGISAKDAEGLIAPALDSVIEPPLFLNGISGLGSPFWSPDFSSRFIGEGSQHEKLAAVMESIAFLIYANYEAINLLAGDADNIVVTGGLASVDGLCERIANLAGTTVTRPDRKEATAHGVGFLLSGAVADTPASHIFKPETDPALLRRYRRWLELLTLSLSG